MYIGTYRYFNDYGFAYDLPTRHGNKTPKWVRPIAKLLHVMNGDRPFIIINKQKNKQTK